jgi:hypothetical protein
VSCTFVLLATGFASSFIDGIVVTRGTFEWTGLAVGRGALGISGRWRAHRRTWSPNSRSENEAMRRHVRKNYD